MKFIIRDDDVNYHYSVNQLSQWYSGITDLCPISICIPAFIKGDFFYWNHLAENHIASDVNDWLKDDKVYPIGDNKELVDYIKQLMDKGQVSISMHGIYHRNDEMEMGEVKNNFIRGAEFYTKRDYKDKLAEAKTYLSDLFELDVCTFTPPQNMINCKGLDALKVNNLSLCGDFASVIACGDCVKMYGFSNYLKLLVYRLKRRPYPYVFYNQGMGFIRHCRLQPSKDLDLIKKEFDYYKKKDGVFVLSTHSYGFDFKMTKYNMTMKEALLDILHYSQQFDNVEYTTLHDLFKKK